MRRSNISAQFIGSAPRQLPEAFAAFIGAAVPVGSLSSMRRRDKVGCAGGIYLFVAVLGPCACACGYHNSVDLSRGVMNWTYPDSLHVRTAVWQAEDAGVLPRRKPDRANDLFEFHRTASALERFADAMAKSVLDGQLSEWSIVLVDSMLWSQFVPSSGSHALQIHADGPIPDRPVLVSDAKVVTALADGTLDGQLAIDRGLIRFYGTPQSIGVLKGTVRRLPLRSSKSTD